MDGVLNLRNIQSLHDHGGEPLFCDMHFTAVLFQSVESESTRHR